MPVSLEDKCPDVAVYPVTADNIDGLLAFLEELEDTAEDYQANAEAGTLTEDEAEYIQRWREGWIHERHGGLEIAREDISVLLEKITDATNLIDSIMRVLFDAFRKDLVNRH
ncbi:hypothetical protein F4677DRAFT_451413 [Hypoxylon crocopeplum]|nr:hypothetical protein F4677DRAFT_451413 [Hypoxylon crocopeplum]